MTDTLLQVLSNADLDWIIACGERQVLSAGQTLLLPYTTPDRLSLVVEGRLGASLARRDVDLDEAVTIAELGPGELVGVEPLLHAPHVTAVTALLPTQVLSLSLWQVQAKLADDLGFGARVYHAIALQLADRLRRRLEHPDRLRDWGPSSGGDVLAVFGELRDSDIDWLTSFGSIASVPSDRVLLQAARPVESLYILLEGQLAMSAPPGTFNPFAQCFWQVEARADTPPAFATLPQGSMPGIMAFLDFRPLPVTVRSLSECLVFAVPRLALATKLQVDNSFASRFYRVIAIQAWEQLQTVSLRWADREAIAPGDDELAMADLEQVSEGAKKFGWMLAQLGVNHHG